MFVTMVIAALIVDGLFSSVALIPHIRPTRADVFGSIKVNYTLFTDILGVAIFASLFALTVSPRRDRPRVRSEGRQSQGIAHGLRRGHLLFLLAGVPTRVRDQSTPAHQPRRRRGEAGNPRAMTSVSGRRRGLPRAASPTCDELEGPLERILAARAPPRRAPRRPVSSRLDGRSGAGKSTLARALARELDAPAVALEDLYGGWDGLEDGVTLGARGGAAPARRRGAMPPSRATTGTAAAWGEPWTLAPPAYLNRRGHRRRRAGARALHQPARLARAARGAPARAGAGAPRRRALRSPVGALGAPGGMPSSSASGPRERPIW